MKRKPEEEKKSREKLFKRMIDSWLVVFCFSMISCAGSALRTEEYKQRFPLHVAARNGNLELVKSYIKSGQFVDSRDIGMNTPLHMSAVHGKYDVASYLLKKGANPKFTDALGTTPSMMAKQSKHYEVMNLIYQHGGDPQSDVSITENQHQEFNRSLQNTADALRNIR